MPITDRTGILAEDLRKRILGSITDSTGILSEGDPPVPTEPTATTLPRDIGKSGIPTEGKPVVDDLKRLGYGVGVPLLTAVMTGGTSLPASAAALLTGVAGGIGSIASQQVEPDKQANLKQAGVDAAFAALPGVPLPQGLSLPVRAGLRASEGFGLGAAQDATSQMFGEGKSLGEVDLGRSAKQGLAGAAIGGGLEAGVGLAGRALQRLRAPRGINLTDRTGILEGPEPTLPGRISDPPADKPLPVQPEPFPDIPPLPSTQRVTSPPPADLPGAPAAQPAAGPIPHAPDVFEFPREQLLLEPGLWQKYYRGEIDEGQLATIAREIPSEAQRWAVDLSQQGLFRGGPSSQMPALEVPNEPAISAQYGGLRGKHGDPTDRPMLNPPPKTVEAIVKRREIVADLAESLGVPVRQDVRSLLGERGRGVLGLFNPKRNVIYSKDANDIGVVSHEVGHKLFMHGALDANAIANDPRLTAELTPHATPGDPVNEGVAEFIRNYISDPEFAKIVYPQFHDYFERSLPPKALAIVQRARDQHWKAASLTDESWLASHMSVGEHASRTSSVVESLFDPNIMIERLWKEAKNPERRPGVFPAVQSIIRRNKRIEGKVSEDPKAMADLLRAWPSRLESWFTGGGPVDFHTYKPTGGKNLEQIITPLREDLAKGEFSKLRLYTMAKHAIERNAAGKNTGLATDRALNVVNAIERDHPEIVQSAKYFTEWLTSGLRYWRDAGGIGGDDYDRMVQAFDSYVPLYRWFGDRAGGPASSGDSLGTHLQPVKRAKGGTQEIIDPIENGIRYMVSMVNAAERLRATKAVAGAFEKMPHAGFVVDRTGFKWERNAVSRRDLGQALDASAQLPPIPAPHSFYGKASTDMDFLLDSYGIGGVIPIMQKVPDIGPNTIAIRAPGTPRGWVYKDVHPDLAQAMKRLDSESADNALGLFLRLSSKTLRSGVVLAPSYTPYNIARDQLRAFLNGGYVLPVVRGAREMARGGDVVDLFLSGGGAQSTRVSQNRVASQEVMKRILDSPQNAREVLTGVIRHPIETAKRFAELGELATRIGIFAEDLGKARDPEAILRATKSARETTADFSRRGTQTGKATRAIPFLGAALSGSYDDVRAFARNPGAYAARLGALVAGGAALVHLLNRDDPRFEATDFSERNTYWHIPAGDQLLRVPKPDGAAGALVNATERTLDYLRDNDPDKYREALQNALLPDLAGRVMPPPLKAFVEWVTGYSFFRGRDYIPFYMREALPETQQLPHTSSLARRVGEATGTSPLKIDTAVRNIGGTVGSEAMNAGSRLLDAASGGPEAPSPQLADAPLISRFFSRSPSTSSGQINTFWKEFGEAKQYKDAIASTAKTNPQKAASMRTENAEAVRFYDQEKATAERLRSMTKQINEIRTGRMTGPEKRRRIDALAAQQNDIAAAALAKRRHVTPPPSLSEFLRARSR